MSGRDDHSIEAALSEIELEAWRLGRSCEQKKWGFRIAHYTVGGTATLAAGAASVTALGDVTSTTVAILAGLAGALSAVQLFLRPAENAALHLTRQVAWDELASSIHDFRTYDLRDSDFAAAREELRRYRAAFYARRRGTVESSPQ